MAPYIFDNAAEAETSRRFSCLDALHNPRTFRFLEATGIRSGWDCLEIGGGSGSVAAWMAERVGASGSVPVTDIDPRCMEGSGLQGIANIELRRHDIGVDPLPEAAFDLIHALLPLADAGGEISFRVGSDLRVRRPPDRRGNCARKLQVRGNGGGTRQVSD